MAPKVSVVIPTRNRAALLRKCLASVSRQTFRDYEVVVVTDASSDETGSVIRAAGLPRLKSVVLKVPSGAPFARAAGLARCSGSYVAFLDDDDEWSPGKLERQLAVMGGTNSSASYTDFDVIGSRGEILYGRCLTSRAPSSPDRPPELRKLIDLYRRGHVRGWPTALFSSVVLRRDALRAVGGLDLRFTRLHDDTDLWLRIYRDYGPDRVDFIAESLVAYRFHPGQISVPTRRTPDVGRERMRSLFDVRVDNTLFLGKVDGHDYCGKREHVCRRVRRGRFTIIPRAPMRSSS
jgi:glycosyltransferase involved in cell wall biosynthesis